MKKSRSDAGTPGLDSESKVQGASSRAFRIVDLQRVSYGTKRAVGRAEIEGFGEFGFEVYQPSDGRPIFIAPESIRNKYTGTYVRTVRFDDNFATELLEAVVARLAVDL